jgi:hypothetical protein
MPSGLSAGDAGNAALLSALAIALYALVAGVAASAAGIPLSWLGLYFDGHVYVEIAKSFPLPYATEGRDYLSHAPGYPGLIYLLRWLTPSALLDWGWLALLASWIPAAGAAAVFTVLCREVGMRPLWPALAFVLLNPRWISTAASPHAESLAMLFALLCLLSHLRGRLGWAMLWLSLAGLTRYPAFLLGVPLAFDALVLRRDLGWRRFATLALPLAAFALWSLYLGIRVSGFPGLFDVRDVPLERAFTWPFAALIRGARRWSFTPHYVITFVSLAVYFASIAAGLRAKERWLHVLAAWVATVVLFHASLSLSLFAHAFTRLAILAWPAALLIGWPCAARRIPMALGLPLCAVVAAAGIGYARQFVVDAAHMQDRSEWFTSQRRSLLELDEPRWLRSSLRRDPEAAAAQPTPTRVVLITVDTLRLDGFAQRPGRASSMPRTRAFASTGRIFENAYSATPNTQPTHASLLTGLHPWEHGITKNGLVLGPEKRTVAEELHSRGFATAAVIASFPLHAKFGFAQGFDVFEAGFDRAIPQDRWGGTAIEGGNFYSLADRVTTQAVALLDRAQAPLQFFWFHYFDPHEPYGDTGGRVVPIVAIMGLMGERSPDLPVALEVARRAYDRDNAFLDRALGRLFRHLQRDSGRWETHVLLTSDHGESFGESGAIGHGHHVHGEQIRVPLFIVSPRVEPGVQRAAAGSVDVATTLLALAGIDERLGSGRDLTNPPLQSETQNEWAAFGMSRAVTEPYSYVGTDGVRVEIRGTRFFAARGDEMITGDADELSTEPRDSAQARWIRSQFARFQRALSVVEVEELTDPETREALEALGYTQ